MCQCIGGRPAGKGILASQASGGTGTPICGVATLKIGSVWHGHYDGLIDDVKVFDRAVSVAEVAFAGSTCRLRPPEKEEGL